MNINLSFDEQVNTIIDIALNEDAGQGDITSEILVPPDLTAKGTLLSKSDGVLAGIDIAGRVFERMDKELKYEVLIKDGSKIKQGDRLAEVSGKAVSILKAERVALNFLQRLSGTATLTAKFVALVEGFPTRIIDTRKTTPGLRLLEKYAVRMGGGRNHRMGLGDLIIIKDNHIAGLQKQGLSLKEVVARARREAPYGMKVQVEVTNAEQAREAVEGGAHMIMFDNMSAEDMAKIIKTLPKHIETESSGGMNLDNARAAAEAGVNFISVGALTHSVKALDISLELEF